MRGEGEDGLPSALGLQQGSEGWGNVHSQSLRPGQVVPGLGGSTPLARHIREQEMKAGELAGGRLVFLGGRQRPVQSFRRLAEPAHGCEQLAEPLESTGMIGFLGQRQAQVTFRLPKIAALEMEARSPEQRRGRG